MSKNWSKEDRESFNKSEVMQEFEKSLLETLAKADILFSKIAVDTTGVSNLASEADKATESVKDLTDAMGKLGDSAEDQVEDGTEDDLRDEVIDDLRVLANTAIAEGNKKLAYKIERTIDEIMEQEVECA